MAARSIQIVVPVDHKFELQTDELKSILEHDNIKNREIVVVSIAGAFRQGKSFLLNFFLKYLNAQYKQLDTSDWIGETANYNDSNGFRWRNGRRRETVGIWMWSEIFTHDFENGRKVAIILLDTQGMFDHNAGTHECTTVFALSVMLSSVQCYNLMQNIQEDNLQHLELFTQYGRLALQQSNEKPFQKLLFLVRDWKFPYENPYGFGGRKLIDDIFAENSQQTSEMHQMRKRLESSFNEFDVFLMPNPGAIVAESNNFTGDLRQIDKNFIRYVKELVPSIFTPEKLIVKKINGQNVRARDLLQYLEVYMKTFNGDTIPEARSVLMATAEANNLIMCNDALNFYVDSMHDSLSKVEYLKEADMENIHQSTKGASVQEFKNKPKLGGDQLALKFQNQLESAIEEKVATHKQINGEKQKNFIERAELKNAQINVEIKANFEQKVVSEIQKIAGAFNYPDLNGVITTEIQTAMQEFDAKKFGDDKVSKCFRNALERELNGIKFTLATVSDAYHKHLTSYADVMREAVDGKNLYFEQSELLQFHQNTKNGILTQFAEDAKASGAQMVIIFQKNIDGQIEQIFSEVGKRNEQKKKAYITSANAHNDNIVREIKANFEKRMQNSIGSSYLASADFINSFMSSKTDALNDFIARKMGDDQLTNSFRERLERELDGLQANLCAKNEANKPPPPPPPPASTSGKEKKTTEISAKLECNSSGETSWSFGVVPRSF